VGGERHKPVRIAIPCHRIESIHITGLAVLIGTIVRRPSSPWPRSAEGAGIDARRGTQAFHPDGHRHHADDWPADALGRA
jgi:hypothetical protein